MSTLRCRHRPRLARRLVGADGTSFDRLDARVPCCGAVVSLTDVHFEEPIGFARFAVSAMIATRAKEEESRRVTPAR